LIEGRFFLWGLGVIGFGFGVAGRGVGVMGGGECITVRNLCVNNILGKRSRPNIVLVTGIQERYIYSISILILICRHIF